MSSTPLMRVRDLSLNYRPAQHPAIHAVRGVSFDLHKGDVLGIAGESGSGKSTLALGCLGLSNPPLHLESGSVRLEDANLSELKRTDLRRLLGNRICSIPQGATGALNPTRKVGSLARDVLRANQPDLKKSAATQLIEDRFALVGLTSETLHRYPCELSGGMQQRSVIAISTLMNPDVVIADEPTSALDVRTQQSVIENLKTLIDEQIIGSMVIITHDLPLLGTLCSRVAIMYAGEIVEIGNVKDVLGAPVHPYTKALLGATLRPKTEGKPKGLKGAPPSLTTVPAGCPFAPRCEAAREDCISTIQASRTARGRKVRCAYAE